MSTSNVEYVTATVYHAVEGQTDSTPLITASGKKINANNPASHRWIAVSRDLEPLGFVYTMGKWKNVSIQLLDAQ